MPKQNDTKYFECVSPKQEKKQKIFGEVKNTILEHLTTYKKEINNNKRNSVKVVPMSLEDLGIDPVALELIEKQSRGKGESSDEQTRRDTMTSVVQELIENVEQEKQIIVVKVDTPAVDLDKNFDDEQLNFIKNDIFNSIQSQLGGELPDDVEEQWDTAFKAMMDIMVAEKKQR